MLRTTCVTTMIDGGHAPNALPQQVSANVNCRILPGVAVASVQARLVEVLADPAITLAPAGELGTSSTPPQLTAAILDPIRAVAAEIRSEEHTSELQSLMRISYAVFCL